MTTSHAFPVSGCPACNAPLSGAATCPACGLRLVGPDAQMLWELDRRLAPLLVERDLLLGRLRGAAAVALDLPSGDSRAVFIALIGLVALAVSGLFPRPAGEGAALSAGALTLIGLWIGLHGHGVSTPEAYTVPLAAVLLAAGAVRYRRNPPTDSASAFGPGLAALLAPSLLVALPDSAGSTGRLLLLLPLCAAVLTLGACLRFKGPVVAGAAGVIATGLLLLVPYADAVPRWVALGLVGLLLAGIGTTYEARQRDLDRVRAKLGVLH